MFKAAIIITGSLLNLSVFHFPDHLATHSAFKKSALGIEMFMLVFFKYTFNYL